MPYEPHGKFDLSLSGNVFVISFSATWNLEGSKNFFSHYKEAVIESGLENFGVLSDMTEFDGGTPEAIDFFEIIADWAQDQGQAARALILDSSMKEYTVKRIDKGKTRCPVQVFHDREAAFNWLENLGLNPFPY